MASLEDLARKKFTDPPLSAAEERVVRHAPDGTVADCVDLGGGDEPEKANGTPEAPDEKWSDSRKVRAELIRWLRVDRAAREQVDPRGIDIQGARITGAIDLSFTNMVFPLFLSGCCLEEDLDLKYAKASLLSLAGSWTGAIAADGLKLEGDILLKNGFHAEGEVRLLGATIGGNLDGTRGTFKDSNGRALSADGINVAGDVSLGGGFSAEGEVRLLGATVGGNLDANGGTFRNLKSEKNPNPSGHALSADGIKVRGDITLGNGFSAEGEVRLPGSTVEGDLNLSGGRFKKTNPEGFALNAGRLVVRGSVFLRDKFFAEGEVRLVGAEIKGQLSVRDAWLDELNLDSAHITGPFFWRNIHKGPNPLYPDKEWNPCLNLTHAKAGALADREASWPEKGRLRLDGFVYDRMAEGQTNATKRLRWLGLQPDNLGFRPQPYEQLIAVLRQMGHEHQVAEVAIAKQWDLRKHGALGWLGQNWFLYLAVGYGYRAWLAFIWLFLLIVLGGYIFSSAHSANMLVPSEQAAYDKYENPKKRELPAVYPRFHPFLYSLDVVSPFDLGQKSHWRLVESISYWKYEFYSLFQLFAGWALLIVAGAVPAGLIKKD